MQFSLNIIEPAVWDSGCKRRAPANSYKAWTG